MNRLSGRTKGNYFLVLIWIICAFIDIYYGENYGGIIYKFFAAAIFAVVATYYLLIDFGKAKPITKRKEISLGIVAIISVLVVTLIIFGNYNVETNKHNVKSEKIPASFDGFRIVQVSDLHNAEFDKYNSTILAPIFHSEPDIIVITGDMIDSRNTDVDVAISFAQKAVNIAPVYYVNGNHESRIPEEYEKLKQGLIDAGVTILENTSADITVGGETITLVGICDPTFRMELFDDNMEQNVAHQLTNVLPDNDNYKVLLAHRPEYFDVYADNVDLVLSGHAHGGQFNIPLVGGIIAPGQGFFPEYYRGLYTKENTVMLVSRGIGNSIFPFRINNKPEIVVAELTKMETDSYDGKYYFRIDVIDSEGVRNINIEIYNSDNDELIYSFIPARARDYQGTMWEQNTYNIWCESSDVGTICYKYENEVWNVDSNAVKPDYIE